MYSPHLTVYEELKNGVYQSPSSYLVAMKYRMKDFNPVNVRERLEFVLQRDDIDEIVAVEEGDDGYLNIILSAIYDEDDNKDSEPVFFMFTVKLFDNDQPDAVSYTHL